MLLTLNQVERGELFPMSDTRYPLRDGFQAREEVFPLPDDLGKLDFQTQMELHICNLFVNERFSISEIVRFAAEDYGTIVRTLLGKKVLVDRRQKQGRPTRGTERRQPENA